MNTNDIISAVRLLEALGAEVVDCCTEPSCEVCIPVLDLAA